jgi:hypothetical protein
VAGGRINTSTSTIIVEIFDTVDAKNSLCQDLSDLPIPVYGAVGSINNYLNLPHICAGRSNALISVKLCQAFQDGIWSNLPNQLNDDRYASTYIDLNDNQNRVLVIGGSDSSAAYFNSGEILDSRGWTRVNGPTTSGGTRMACMVLYNSTTGLFIGGYQSGVGKKYCTLYSNKNTNKFNIFNSDSKISNSLLLILYRGKKF